MVDFKIRAYEKEIIQSIRDNNVTIISTPTGSGKTMAVPYWAWQISQEKVFCLVPRVVMARQAAKGAAKLVWENSLDVGHMTGRGNKYGRKVIYATEGSYIARQIGEKSPKGSVLCIDEVHEQGAMTEATLFLAKQWVERGMKLVILSATMDCQKYKDFYSEFSVGVIDMPTGERPYELDFITIENPIKACVEAAQNGGRVLIGVQGKANIDNTIAQIQKLDKNIRTFGFHAEIENEDQDAAISYDGPAIYIATNVLQSGVTIPNLTHGYFNGIGKRIENEFGMSKLCQYNLSQAEMKQWFGRIGRNCPGIIFQTSFEANSFNNRDKMPSPEIQLIPLDDIYLQFLQYGINMGKAELLNKPDNKMIEKAKESLIRLNLIKKDSISSFGKDAIKIGAGVRGGIMISVGQKLGIENTMRKIQAIDYIGHPFRNTSKRFFSSEILNEYSYSDYMIWLKTIENIIFEHGYTVNKLEYPIFKEKMENENVFRKNLTKLMRAFKSIDETCSDTAFSPKKVKVALYMANKDRIVNGNRTDEGYLVEPSFKSLCDRKKWVFGPIFSVGLSTFIEGVTTISEEEKKDFDILLGFMKPKSETV